jgi:hypothetical protein
MGVENYLIEGVSCAGKTTVCNALLGRGYHAIHGDNELAFWGDPRTGESLVSTAYEHWIWDVGKVKALLADHTHKMTFLCGGSRNHASFIDLLDGVFVLEVDLNTLNKRLALRPAGEWSGSPGVGETSARLQHAKQEYIPKGAIMIDATASIDRVVDAILARCSACD